MGGRRTGRRVVEEQTEEMGGWSWEYSPHQTEEKQDAEGESLPLPPPEAGALPGHCHPAALASVRCQAPGPC